ncbi:MAG TPA: LLM class flavin-dependent oxidoreductase [Gaiellaceae bacterium]
MPFVLSVLDQSPISEGSTGADALRNSIDLARHTETLGYERYWVAEHHGTPMLASAAPEILIAEIAAATSRIRVGSGGVMLPHYSPLKVAEVFSMLAALHPGRVDLGIGRAPGTDPHTMFALQRDRRQAAPDDFPEQLAELLALLEGDLPPDHPFSRLTALPGGPERPEVWLLGSSSQSAIWAAELGLPYSVADFINPKGAELAHLYRERFQPSARRDAPRVAAAVSTICAETDEEAQRLAASARMAVAFLHSGRLIPVPPVEKALAFFAEHDVPPTGRRAVVGAPDTVRAGLEEVAREYGADELMLVTITHDHTARRRSYELVAGAF